MESSDKKMTIESIFDRWGEHIEELREKMSDVKQLNHAQLEMYAKRQNLVEERGVVLINMAEINSQVKALYSQKYKEYKEKGNLIYKSEVQLENLIKGELADKYHKLEMYKVLAEFYEETLKTIDNMIYGVRNVITIHQLANGDAFK